MKITKRDLYAVGIAYIILLGVVLAIVSWQSYYAEKDRLSSREASAKTLGDMIAMAEKVTECTKDSVWLSVHNPQEPGEAAMVTYSCRNNLRIAFFYAKRFRNDNWRVLARMFVPAEQQ